MSLKYKDQPESVRILMKALADKGQLVAAGFEAFASLCIPKDVSEAQRRDMRVSFMAGALYLFEGILVGLDDGSDATNDDCALMNKISDELDAFGEALREHVTGGDSTKH